MLYLEKAWTLCDSRAVYYLPFWSVFPLNKFIFEIILCALHFVAHKMVCWWFVQFHNRQNKVRVKKEVPYITSLLLPNYYDYKKDINENENSSNCFPDDLITLAAFSICE